MLQENVSTFTLPILRPAALTRNLAKKLATGSDSRHVCGLRCSSSRWGLPRGCNKTFEIAADGSGVQCLFRIGPTPKLGPRQPRTP
jgi:hypothetical protein